MSQAQTSEVVRASHDAYRRGEVTAAGAQLADSFSCSSPITVHTSLPAGIQRCAEHFRIAGGRISSIIIISTPHRGARSLTLLRQYEAHWKLLRKDLRAD